MITQDAAQDSLMEGSSNNVDRETILFPRAHTDESADEKLNPLLPQLTLQVLDSETQHKMDALTRSLKVERTALQALAENLQDDRQIRSCSYSRYENEILRLMERNSAFVNFELSLIKDGVLKVTYKEYRPKLIHIMMELIKVYQNAWNSEIVRSYARIFVDIYVKKEAEHGRKYKGVAYDASGVVPTSILKDHGPNFSGEQLLGELEEEWKEFCAKEGKNGGTPLPKEGSQSKSLVLPLRPGPGSHTGHTTQSQR
ncbi:hypothetical protein H0H93_005854 [Arthromyces matolae]|nr:hypothetical protein H0H93_005854 [Arthromyces matolae]